MPTEIPYVPFNERLCYSVAEAAASTSFSIPLINVEISRGNLIAHRRGGKGEKRIYRTDLEAWIEGRKEPAVA